MKEIIEFECMTDQYLNFNKGAIITAEVHFERQPRYFAGVSESAIVPVGALTINSRTIVKDWFFWANEFKPIRKIK